MKILMGVLNFLLSGISVVTVVTYLFIGHFGLAWLFVIPAVFFGLSGFYLTD